MERKTYHHIEIDVVDAKRSMFKGCLWQDEEALDQRKAKCALCIDEVNKRFVLLNDDLANCHFKVLVEPNFIEAMSSDPMQFVKVVRHIANWVGIEYIPVDPTIIVPDDESPSSIDLEGMSEWARESLEALISRE